MILQYTIIAISDLLFSYITLHRFRFNLGTSGPQRKTLAAQTVEPTGGIPVEGYQNETIIWYHCARGCQNIPIKQGEKCSLSIWVCWVWLLVLCSSPFCQQDTVHHSKVSKVRKEDGLCQGSITDFTCDSQAKIRLSPRNPSVNLTVDSPCQSFQRAAQIDLGKAFPWTSSAELSNNTTPPIS